MNRQRHELPSKRGRQDTLRQPPPEPAADAYRLILLWKGVRQTSSACEFLQRFSSMRSFGSMLLIDRDHRARDGVLSLQLSLVLDATYWLRKIRAVNEPRSGHRTATARLVPTTSSIKSWMPIAGGLADLTPSTSLTDDCTEEAHRLCPDAGDDGTRIWWICAPLRQRNLTRRAPNETAKATSSNGYYV